MGGRKELLQERYEIRGDERDFLAAMPLYEEALETAPTAELFRQYGYLLECHGRRELRRAAEQYRRAVELEPDDDKARYMLIAALADLGDGDEMIALYERRVVEAPDDVRAHRFLARAYLAARDFERARAAVAAGLERSAGDRLLIEFRGEARAGLGDVEGALADWTAAAAPENTDSGIAPLFSRAYLLEREGRVREALAEWRAIVDWCERNGTHLETEFTSAELARIRALIG